MSLDSRMVQSSHPFVILKNVILSEVKDLAVA
jgi:hypothetical protein